MRMSLDQTSQRRGGLGAHDSGERALIPYVRVCSAEDFAVWKQGGEKNGIHVEGLVAIRPEQK